MLESKGAELHGDLRENLFDLPVEQIDFDAEEAAEAANEMQLAGGNLLRQMGLNVGRIVTGDVSGKMGRIQKRIREKLEEQEAERQAATPAQDALQPDLLQQQQTPTAPLDPSSPAPTVPPSAAQATPPSVADDAAEVIDGEDAILGQGPARLSDEQQEQYDYYKTDFGDEQINRLMESRMQRPELKDGLIAGSGIRAVGTQPGMEQKIPDEGNVLSLIGQMAKEIQNNVPTKQLEKISLEETAELADLVNTNPKRLTEMMKRGLQVDPTTPGALAAHVSAAKNLFVSEAIKLDRMMDVAGRADATLEQKLLAKQQSDLVAGLQGMYKGAVTDIARALNATKLPARETRGMTPDEIAQFTGRDYRKLADDLGGVNNIDAFIEGYRNLDDMKARMKYINSKSFARKVFDAWHEVWINSILSGTWSHIKNLAGGIAAIFNENAATAVAAGYQGITRGVFRANDGIRDVTFGDLQAKMFGQTMAVREALVAAGRGFITREELFGSSKLEARGGGSEGQLGTLPNQFDAFSAGGLGVRNRVLGHGIDALGNLLTLGRAPTRALVAGDSFVKVVAYRGALYELAYRDARLADLKGDAFSDHVADFVTSPPGKAVEEAQQLARISTLQNELDEQTKNLQKTLRGPVLSWIVPFFKTPMNAIFYARDNSPLAYFFTPYKEAMAQGGAAAAKAQAKMALGTMVMGFAGMYASTGNITGSISSDPKVRAAYLRRGITPYSVRIPGTNKWVPYNTIEPVSTIIGLAVDAYESIQNYPGATRTDTETLLGVSAVIGHNLVNKTFMVGVSQFLDTVQDPQKLPRMMMNYATSATVPGSALFNEMSRLQNDVRRYRRKTGIDYSEKVSRGIQSRLPFVQENLKPARDAWGRVTNRSRITMYDPNPVDEEIARLQLPYAPYPEGESSVVLYDDEQLDYFHEVTGKKAFEELQKFLKDSEFKQLQKASKAGNNIATEQLQHIIRKIRLQAIQFGKGEVRNHPVFGPQLDAVDDANEKFFEQQQEQLEADMQ